MDPLIQVPKPQNSSKHNQPVILYDPDPIKGAYRLVCMQEKIGLISVESYQQKLKTILEQETQLCKKNIQLFQDWHNKILIYKNNLISSLDKTLQVVVDQMKLIKINTENLQQLSQQSTDHQKTIADVQQKSQNSQNDNEQVKQQVKQQLVDFEKKYFHNLNELLNQLDEKPKIKIKVAQIDEGKFQYELIKESCKEEKKWCWAFAFNKECNILVVACGEKITINQFNKGTIKEIQRLTDHTDNVFCLYFMKQSNSFISGSCDNSIIIWDFDKVKNQWYALSILKDHTDYVYCLQMSKCEDLLISGSSDKTIKFWNKINSSWSIQQTVTAIDKVYDFSLNEKENKLTFFVYQFIQILEKGNDKKWRIVQTINSDGLRLCFTVGDQFVFQPYNTDKMEVYEYNQSKKQFDKVQEVQIQIFAYDDSIFPCQYIQKLNIVAVKNGIYLNIFQIDQIGKYQNIQTIQFRLNSIYGRLSDDGEYLVTWDNGSRQIQVRSLKCIE